MTAELSNERGRGRREEKRERKSGKEEGKDKSKKESMQRGKRVRRHEGELISWHSPAPAGSQHCMPQWETRWCERLMMQGLHQVVQGHSKRPDSVKVALQHVRAEQCARHKCKES